jgi:glycosyltransferase involved in cell wall biosynthesis
VIENCELRIGMLIWSYFPDAEGGAERQCRILAESLLTSGHSCEVLAGGWGTNSSDGVLRFGSLCPLENQLRRMFQKVSSGFSVHMPRLAQHASFWLLVPFSWIARLSFIISIAAFVRNHPQAPFDVIHVHDSGWLAGVGVWLGRKWGIPVLCKEATSPALQPVSYGTPFRRYWEWQRKFADGWVAQTENVRNQLVAAGIPADRVYLVPNGVCIPDVVRPASDHDGVLYVGNLTQGSEWKAFDVLFDAWIEIVQKRPAARLVFVGGGDPVSWRQALSKAGVLDSVTFVGRLDDPSPRYGNAGIFVLPSRVEGMSNALLEAQSWGLGCVVSDIPGNTAVVQHEANGLVVPVNDAVALADAIIRLLDDKEWRCRLGAAARANAVANFSMSAFSERIVDVYRELCAGEASG